MILPDPRTLDSGEMSTFPHRSGFLCSAHQGTWQGILLGLANASLDKTLRMSHIMRKSVFVDKTFHMSRIVRKPVFGFRQGPTQIGLYNHRRGLTFRI